MNKRLFLTRLAREHPFLSAILVIFVLLSGLYSMVTPVYEAPDEIGHFTYIKYLADHRTFPVFEPAGQDKWIPEGRQLPLYYLLGALPVSLVDTSDADQLWHFNPHAIVGTFRGVGNRNWVAHTREEQFPYHGTVLAIHLVRLLSILMGAATVLITYFIAWEIFPGRKGLASGVALLVAFNPQFLFISGAVNNDNLATLLSSAALLAILTTLRKGASTPRLISLGIILGLAALTKLNLLGLLPLGLLALVIMAKRQRSPALLLKGIAILLFLVFLIAGWWYVRNWALYGDPMALSIHPEAGARRENPFTLQSVIGQAKAIKKSYWATFGWFNIQADPILYHFFDGLALLGGLGLILAAIRVLRGKLSLPLDKLSLLLTWTVIMAIEILGWMWKASAYQGRILFPAISAISFFLFFGLSQLTPPRYTTLLAGLLGGIMLFIAIVTPFRYIAPAYAKPPLISEDEIASIPHRLDVTFGDQMRLLGYAIDQTSVKPGDKVSVTLYWQSVAKMDKDYTIFVHLLDELETVVAQVNTFPGLGSFPTRDWEPGDAIVEEYILRLSGNVLSPNFAQFEVGLLDPSNSDRLPAYGPDGQFLGDNVHFYRLEIEEGDVGRGPIGVFVNFENSLSIAAYQLERWVVSPGSTIHLVLHWQALTDLDENYLASIRLLGRDGASRAQVEGQLTASPASPWTQGQTVQATYDLPLRLDTPPDIYEIEVRLQRAKSGETLTILDAEGQPQDERALISRVRIEAP